MWPSRRLSTFSSLPGGSCRWRSAQGRRWVWRSCASVGWPESGPRASAWSDGTLCTSQHTLPSQCRPSRCHLGNDVPQLSVRRLASSAKEEEEKEEQLIHLKMTGRESRQVQQQEGRREEGGKMRERQRKIERGRKKWKGVPGTSQWCSSWQGRGTFEGGCGRRPQWGSWPAPHEVGPLHGRRTCWTEPGECHLSALTSPVTCWEGRRRWEKCNLRLRSRLLRLRFDMQQK